MSTRGKHETDMLKANIDDQLNRLLTQLEDLEELKDGATNLIEFPTYIYI